MSNIDQIEAIMSRTTEVPRLTGAVGASLAHWASRSVLYMLVSAEQTVASEARNRLEDRVAVMSDVLAWAASYAHPDFLPNPEEVVQQFIDQQEQANGPATDEEALKEHAELFGITVEQARADMAAAARDRAAEVAALQQAAEASKAHYVHSLREALHAEVDEGFEVDAVIGQRIVDRIAGKADQAAQKRSQQGAATVRQRRRQALAAEYRLICGICEQADTLFEQFEDAANGEMNRNVDHPAHETAEAPAEVETAADDD